MSKLSKFIFLLFLTASLFFLKVSISYAACTVVPSNQTTCTGTQTIACMQPTPVAGNINRWCCDDQTSCDAARGIIQQQITNQVASNNSSAFPELRYPCDKVKEPKDFHSLRPYQAAHCGDANKARYCSNDLKFVETFDSFPECESQAPDTDGEFDCSPTISSEVRPHNLLVTLDDSMFPIMGNTEEVKNGNGGTEVFDDATKVNEYASWYLSGVNNRAEYGENTNDKVVNFSGPIQKLLPKMIQEAERIKTIEKATINGEPWTDEDDGKTYTTPQNHDQVVVCADQQFFGLFGKTIPKPCYGEKGLRLSEWTKDLSFLRSLSNFGLSLFESLPDWAKGFTGGLVDSALSVAWNKRYPPLPWSDENKKPFKTDIEYQKAYNEWQGKSCIIVLNHLFCIDNPGVTNTYADLYSYIPLSNTTDKKGNEFLSPEHPIYNPSAGTVITPPTNDPPKNAPLYFAHTQEVKESAELLNKTFTPLDCPKDESGNPVENEKCKLLKNSKGPAVETNNCSAANVRVNKGDNLFPGDPNEIQVNNVHYFITSVKCKVKITEKPCPHNPDPACVKIDKKVTCHAEVSITLKTKTKTPNADEIFNETVAGTGSTFRKIFPKVQEGAPVSCIGDIPTVTNVTYDGTNTLQGGDSVFSVTRFPEDGAGDSPQLTFPHVGSVYEYFLKGIQTALRPKGYGEPIASGKLCSTLDGGDCTFDMAKINAAITKAAAKYSVPEELLRAIFEIESYEYIYGGVPYVCEENSAGAAGIASIKKPTYDIVTCGDEKMDNDIPMCGSYRPKLSRCNIDDAIELMARVLLWDAGKLSNCQAIGGGISLSNKMEWYNASCMYGTGFTPTAATINLSQDIPVSERRQNGDMNYCDIVCWKLGQCPAYP